MIVLALLAGCPPAEPTETDSILPGVYTVEVSTDPDPPVAAQAAEVWLTVRGPDGEPVEDLQAAHERVVHTFLIPRDLQTFAHLHHEDFYPLTAGDLRSGTFHFPYAFPASGGYFLSFEFAHQNQYRSFGTSIEVDGSVPQLAEPVLDLATTAQSGDVTAELVWDVPPKAGQEAAWRLYLTTPDGEVGDIVQWLGADAHAAIVSTDLSYVGHTHAWVAGMEDAPPGHAMPHQYDGPDLPFRAVLPWAGSYKIWVQFARADAPDEPVVVAFMFEVPE